MSAFAWLNDLVQFIGKWFPRLTLVRRGNASIQFCPGGRVITRSSGLFVWWPLIHQTEEWDLKLRSLELAVQIHGREAVQLVVFYSVVSPELAATKVRSMDGYLDDKVQAALRSAMASPANDHDIEGIVRDLIAVDMEPLGVEVQRVSVAQRLPIFAIKTFAEYGTR